VPGIENPQSDPVVGPELPGSPTLGAQIDIVTGFLRRRYLFILIGLLLSLPLGALYLYVTPPVYTASATMMIETRKGPLDPLLGGLTPDTFWIDSQIGILKSQNIAAYVVKQQRLAEDPEFIRSGVGPLDKLIARLGWEAPDPKSEPERVIAAIGVFSNGLDVRRVAQSYLMRIDFRSQNPEQAAKIANAVIDAYIFDQLNAKYQANRRAGDWLQERLQALREQAAAAERAAIDFRAKNNIVSVAGGGVLMNEKELTDISGGRVSARVHASDVQMRLERIEAVRKAFQEDKPNPAVEDETISEAMNSGIINNLRTKYLDLVNREADWSVRYGKNHTAVVNLRNQIRDIRKSIIYELGRIEESWKSEYELAKKREEEFDKSLGKLVSQSTETNQAQITLFSLEAAAKSYRRLYDNFLQRHTESVQQQTFPISDARAVSAASAIKSSPRTLQVWVITIFAGGIVGVGLGAWREIMDRGFRTREQIQSALATECLALVPLLADGRRRRFLPRRQSVAMEPMRRAQFAIAHQPSPRSINSGPRIMRTITDSPSCPYAEAIRSIKLTVDLNKGNQATAKIIGLTSCLPSEGKSSVAAAMASLIAQGGARVILVDCDLRNPSLSRALAPNASFGFLDVVAGKANVEDAVWNDANTNMAFLPAGRYVPNASEMLTSVNAKLLFDMLQIKYDYVIVDLSPLVAGVDVRATSGLIDSYVLVIAWGSTKIDAVQYALRNAPQVHANLVGAVLNKVDMAVMSRYDSHGSGYYYGQPRNAGSVH
jgi:polysaccharide biosynthesis transport protein